MITINNTQAGGGTPPSGAAGVGAGGADGNRADRRKHVKSAGCRCHFLFREDGATVMVQS